MLININQINTELIERFRETVKRELGEDIDIEKMVNYILPVGLEKILIEFKLIAASRKNNNITQH